MPRNEAIVESVEGDFRVSQHGVIHKKQNPIAWLHQGLLGFKTKPRGLSFNRDTRGIPLQS